MAINIFEGARRIALLLGGGAAVITVLVAFNQDAYYHATYSLAAPNAPFRKTDDGCPSEGRAIDFNHKTSSGKEVRVSVCLEPMTFPRAEVMSAIEELKALAREAIARGDRDTATRAMDKIEAMQAQNATNKNKEETELIPYKTDADGMTWGGRRYSSEISTYETQVKKRFTMTATDEATSIKEAAKMWRSQFAEAMGYLAAGLAIFGALVWAVGWIVRGFMGIPRGSDVKPQP